MLNDETVHSAQMLRGRSRPGWVARHPPTKAAFPAAVAHACAALQISIHQHRRGPRRPPYPPAPVSHAADACFLPAVVSDRTIDGPAIPEATSPIGPSTPFSASQPPSSAINQPEAPNPDQAQAEVQTRIQIAISKSQPWKTMGPSPRATTPATGGTGYVWSASRASYRVFAVD